MGRNLNRQIIDLRGEVLVLRGDLKKAETDRDRKERVGRVAMRDFLRSQDVLAGLSHVTKAAEYFISTGHPQVAANILSCMTSVHVDELRKRVVDEQALEQSGTGEKP